MSRRGDKAWGEFVNEHTFGGGEEYHVDWESAARALDVPTEDFVSYHPEDGYPEIVNTEELRDAVRSAFDNPNGEEPPPLVMVTLKCQRCDRRLDTLRLRSGLWTAPKPGSGEGWKLEKLRVTSESFSKEVGDSTNELFRQFEGRSLDLACACGRQHIQFSVRRLRDTLDRLTPKKPVWLPDNDEGHILRPRTRHATIRG